MNCTIVTIKLKSQISSTKFQINHKTQYPNSRKIPNLKCLSLVSRLEFGILSIGIYLLFEICYLGFPLYHIPDYFCYSIYIYEK